MRKGCVNVHSNSKEGENPCCGPFLTLLPFAVALDHFESLQPLRRDDSKFPRRDRRKREEGEAQPPLMGVSSILAKLVQLTGFMVELNQTSTP